MKKRIYAAAAAVISLCMTVSPAAGSSVFAETLSEAETESSMTESDKTEVPVSEDDGSVSVSRIRFASDYKEIYETLKKAEQRWYYDDLDYYVVEDAEYDAGPMRESNTAKAESAAAEEPIVGGSDYSETNVRTQGVDESDVVKTDGNYIYILRHNRDLAIVKAEGADMEKVSEIRVAEEEPYWYSNLGAREFFVQGNNIFVISEHSSEDEPGYSYGTTGRYTSVATYDISNPSSPVRTGEMRQDGTFLQARMRDGMLYLFTEWRPYVSDSFEDSVLTVKAGGKEILPEDTCIPNIVTDTDYLVISSVNPERPSDALDSKVLISGAQQLYVSTGGIYAVNADYSSNREKTEIVKFTYENGSIEGKAAGTVRGSIHDSFAIDEYDGYLRVLTTYTGSVKGNFMELLSDLFGFDYYDDDMWTRHNALFVLDEDMNPVSRIIDLAKGEEIRSARYFGNTGYFVTFRNTDPLFTVDLSDPKHPVITDELKVPGFSSYLHPFGENLLLGLGYDADENTGSITGIKLSLFDLSGDEVVEKDRTVIRNITSFPAVDDYKAVFADPSGQLVGFWLSDRYLVYRHTDDGGFERVLLYDYFDDDLQGSADYSDVRGLYIGSTFYIAGGDAAAAFDMEDGFAKIGLLRL